jgi:hypothetical protein
MIFWKNSEKLSLRYGIIVGDVKCLSEEKMKIVVDSISFDEIKQMAAGLFGDMVKAVVDVDQELLAIDAELHADLEALLLEHGSKQKNLWGINLYPELSGNSFIEYDSMINVRPSQNNRSRSVGDEAIRAKIAEIVAKKVAR